LGKFPKFLVGTFPTINASTHHPPEKNQHFLVGAIDKPFPVMAGLLHCFNHIRGFKHHTVVERLTIMFNMVLPI
jgi:hypothetical protein